MKVLISLFERVFSQAIITQLKQQPSRIRVLRASNLYRNKEQCLKTKQELKDDDENTKLISSNNICFCFSGTV